MADAIYTAAETFPREVLERWRRHHMGLRRHPRLRALIWQATVACNLRCRHCAATKQTDGDLSREEVSRIFDDVAAAVDVSRVRVGITGGEPTLRKDLHHHVAHLRELGFAGVGLATNGFLLGRRPERLDELVDHGLDALNVSLDGPEDYHNALRHHPRAFRFATAAIERARRRYPQVSTALTITVSPGNFETFHQIVRYAEEVGVPLVKVVAIMPYRRAAENPELFLSSRQFVTLLERVASHRRARHAGKTGVQVTMTDDGFLGKYESQCRSGLFNSAIGVTVATLWHDGRLAGCPQIPQDFNFQGDLTCDPFEKLWREQFKGFRNRSWLKRGECRVCPDWRYCFGGSLHDRDAQGNLLRCNALRIRDALSDNRLAG